MSRFWPEILLILIEVTLGSVTFFEGMTEKLFASPIQLVSAVSTLQLTFASVYIAFKMLQHQHQAGEIFRRLTGPIDALLLQVERLVATRSEVRALRQQEFYKQFSDSIDLARSAVDIAHLDTRPPGGLVGSPEKEYYSSVLDRVRRKREVAFRRVERVARDKCDWITEIVKTYQGLENFSLACLIVDEKRRKLPYVSVQLVDENISFLVAVSEHSTPRGCRDIFIKDSEASSLWKTYYEKMLWEDALKVIEHGQLNEPVWKRVQKALGNK